MLHAAPVLERRSRGDDSREARVRSRGARESRKDLPHSRTLSRVPAARNAVNDMAVRVRPRTYEECAAALGSANADRRTVRVRGAGTKDYLGDLVPTDLVVETLALRGVVAHVPADLTITLAAGTPFVEMRDALAREG